MPDQAGSLERLALLLAEVLTQVTHQFGDNGVLDTFDQLGVHFPDELLTNATITTARRTVFNAGADLKGLTAKLLTAIDGGDAEAIVAASLALVTQCGRVTASFSQLADALGTAGTTLPGVSKVQIDALVQDLPRRITDLLLADLAEVSGPAAAVLEVLGVVDREFSPGDPADPTRPPYEAVTVHLDRLLPAITDPVRQLGRLYGWGTASFDAARLLTVLESVTARLGLPVVLVPGTATTPPELQIFAVDLGPSADGAGLRVGMVLPAEGQGGFDVPLSPPTWSAHVEATGRVVAESAGEIRPPFDISLKPPSGGAAEPTGSVAFSVRAQPAEPFLLLGVAGGSRLDFTSARVDGGVRLQLDPVTGEATATPEVVGEITGGRLVIDTSEADGFIAAVLGDQRLQSDFGVGFSFTPDSGLRFHGSGGLEIRLPVHAALGPVEMQAVYLRVAIADDGSVPVELSAAFSAALGPVRASVDRIGVRAELTFPEGGGNLGPADLAFGFRPPSGVGLAVDAGGISGGGFLDFHPERGEYSGALELEFADFLALKAIGLITTRQPDGSRGFSLLIVLTGEFGSGIQLGYGFTLLAVGGLIGLNRGMNLQALVEGVRTGSIESVAFPRDVIANAPRILSDLNRFFPPEQGTFLVGPMAKIGWGTPTLVSISLGVIIEIPGNIAVLGVLRAALPTADRALLVIQAQFVGALELDKSRLWFFAQLFESRILTMTVDGGMGVLVAWGDNPDLVVTVGGFHPAYRPPPLPFPIPDRLSVDLLNRRNQLIRVSGYFAITSNTVQFGAKAELKLGFSAFGVEGHLGFDALFQFSPFRFAIHISAEVTLKAFGVGAFGIDLDFQLEGPAPWRAHGRGSIGFLFFSVSANFDITWGEERDTTLPPVAVLPLLAAEIRKTEGWETRLPSGGNRALVSLRQLPDTDDLVLHPLGTLFVRQRALPLNVRLDRIGGQRASDGRRFSVAPLPDSGLKRVSDTGDRFAMAQFQNMSDAAKLSRPSYETQDAGLELAAASGTLASARVVRRSARYELHIIDSGTATSPAVSRGQLAVPRGAVAAATAPKRFHNVSGAVFDELLSGNSTSRAALSQRQARLRQPFATADTVRVTEQRFVVAYVKSNRQAFPPGSLGRPSRGAAATFRSLTTARDALADFVEADPGLTGRLHVIPASEAAASPAVPGTWSDAGLLPVPASEVDLMPLTNGRILLAGGTGPTGAPLAATALFDPTADAWSPGPPLATGRRRHTTTALADGRVLALGGRTATAPLASAEVFDPAAGTWTPVAAPMGTARYGHSATRLKDGRVLVAGGSGGRTGQEDGALASAELYDPATSTWAAVAPMTDARTGHRAVLLGDDRVLVVGGALPTGRDRQSALAYCELYDPATRTWTPTGSLAEARKGHQATALPDGRVLVTGGDPVVAPDGTLDPKSLAGAELYDPKTGEWTAAAGMPGGGRSGHRSLLLRSGVVLVIGGTGAPELTAGYRSVVAYSPEDDAWTTIGGLGLGRFALGAVELTDDRVLVGGGVAAADTAAESLDAVQPAGTGEVLIP
ncbi:DUF6603 domain-containing protein [Streptomyces phaeochromogenes]|uniref:DUF6603 domain-containing protein n=1 Tax=Streptomyces phaeochromogenes TaxID=1923 RepID=UPI002DDB4FBD|nr:DUF6603 domain-containing protein [Streptomyces phaeochromogenes]WRZ35595.1 hypothetical protein OG931_51600 [Streptomyces phaeochromogenes]